MTQLGLLGEALDIPIRQPAHVTANDQRLQRPGANHGSGVRDHLTDEALGGVAHLGHGNADLTLSGLDRLWPGSVTRAISGRRPLVPCSAKEGSNFFLHGPLQHQAGSQPSQRG